MSQLEQTILECARDALSDLKYYHGEPRTTENLSAFMGYWQRLNTFAHLGNLMNSGLTDAAVGELQRIDSEAAAVFSSYTEPRLANKEMILSNVSTTLARKDLGK